MRATFAFLMVVATTGGYYSKSRTQHYAIFDVQHTLTFSFSLSHTHTHTTHTLRQDTVEIVVLDVDESDLLVNQYG